MVYVNVEMVKGKAVGTLGISTANLAPDMERINGAVDSFGILLISGTFNVSLSEHQKYTRTNEVVMKRNEGEVLSFQRCRLRSDGSNQTVRCLLIRSSIHENSIFKNTLEIMSSIKLRNSLNIAENDDVAVELNGDDAWWNEQ